MNDNDDAVLDVALMFNGGPLRAEEHTKKRRD